jgi:multidrug transporter EmrE-like cation transporter
MNIGWMYFVGAMILSFAANYLLKSSKGFEHMVLGGIAVFLLLFTNVLWGLSIKTLPMSTLYALWSGLGVLVIVLMDVFIFNEPMSALRLTFIAMVVVGAIGLKVIT